MEIEIEITKRGWKILSDITDPPYIRVTKNGDVIECNDFLTMGDFK